MKKAKLVLPIVCILSACSSGKNNSYNPETYKCYAYFMNNYPRVTEVSPSGNEVKTENTVYERVEIEAGVPFAKPSDPERTNYEFQGWFKEKACTNAWDFANDSSDKTLYLYAKWGQVKEDEYMEPEYVFPEKIIPIEEADNFRLNGIFNTPIAGGEVNLTTGSINRLVEHASDVKFAIQYERKASVTFTASYNTATKVIHVAASTSEEFDVHVNDVTDTMRVANSTYESKAQNYEEKGTRYENYHIALGGSSSMENWATSDYDMMPIISFNHGIGGTSAEEWRDSLFQRLMLPYLPKAVVYYVGVNDIINNGRDGAQTGAALVELFNKTHQFLPDSQIFYVLINKLPGFATKQADFDAANGAALDYAAANSYLTCIDAGQGLLKPDGTPNSAYFLTDGLHMSKYGYVIWGAAVKEAIKNWLDK